MSVTKTNLEFSDFRYICRICLIRGDTRPLSEDLRKLLTLFVKINIEDEDQLPRNICSKCVTRLNDIKVFLDLTLNSDALLKDVLLKHRHKVTLEFFDNDSKFEISEEDTILFDENDNDNKKLLLNCVSNKDCDSEYVEIIMEENDLIKKQQFYCKICENVFITIKDLVKHRQQNKDCTFKCQICKEIFETNEKLNKHKIENENCKVEEYKCTVCAKVFKTKSLLKRHRGVHSDEPQYDCKLCDKKFKFPQNLRRHVNIVHKGIKPFKCDICGKGYGQPGMLKDHMNTHGIKLYTCEYCQQKYGTWTNFHKHIKKHKMNQEDLIRRAQIKITTGPVKCQICLKDFCSKNSLKVHKHTVHTNIEGYLCAMCGKKFNRRLTLAFHLKTHSSEKPHECELCNKTFKRLGQLKTHMDTHTKEKKSE